MYYGERKLFVIGIDLGSFRDKSEKLQDTRPGLKIMKFFGFSRRISRRSFASNSFWANLRARMPGCPGCTSNSEFDPT